MKTENFIQSTKETLLSLYDNEKLLKKYVVHGEESLSREELWETLLNSALDRLCFRRSLPLKDFMEGLERRLIIRALFKAQGNRKKAASLLGVNYTTFHEKLKKYNIRFKNMAY